MTSSLPIKQHASSSKTATDVNLAIMSKQARKKLGRDRTHTQDFLLYRREITHTHDNLLVDLDDLVPFLYLSTQVSWRLKW